MDHDIDRRRLLRSAAAMAASAAIPAWAQNEKPTTLIVPAPPGGSNDAVARITAEALATLTQRPVLIDNRAGAGGTIGFGLGAKGPPDGSVLVLTASVFAITPAVFKKLPFDVLKDFAGVAGLARSPLILVAHSQFPAQSARDLKGLLQRASSRIAFATGGDSSTLLATTQLLAALGVKALVVPYKGTAPAMTDVAGGHVALSVTTLAAAMPFIKGGQVKPLGLLANSRLKALPEIPTLTEQGIDIEFMNWLAIHAPAQVPKSVINKLGADLQRVVDNPAFEARLEGIYATPFHLGPRELDEFVVQQVKQMASLASAAGLQPE